MVVDKIALYAEFEEWIELEDEHSIDILSTGIKIIKEKDIDSEVS